MSPHRQNVEYSEELDSGRLGPGTSSVNGELSDTGSEGAATKVPLGGGPAHKL